MRRKKLLTAALCAVLLLAADAVSLIPGVSSLKASSVQSAAAAETADQDDKEAAVEIKHSEESKKPVPAAEQPVTSVAETQPATSAPETQPATQPATSAPETQPATQPATSAPETQLSTETPTLPPSETTPPAGTPEQTETAVSGTETPETTPSETQPSESVTATETPGSDQNAETEQQSSAMAPETEVLPGETASGQQTEAETKEKETDEEKESETSLYESNEELIAHQKIVVPPDISLEFRFTQVEKQYAIVSNREGAAVYEERSEDARAVGVLSYYGCCCILEEKDGWYYVESGNVRGFVKASELVSGEAADRIVQIKGIEQLSEARLLISRTDNKAFTYTHTTVKEVLVDKVYALANTETTIYEQRTETSEKVGILAEGALCYILADEQKDWVFVESGEARGFVQRSQLITGTEAEKRVEEAGEKNLELAEVLIAPEDNKSCYYTLSSVQEASQEAKTREAMVNFALQFVGNPYVWGGTSLTNGADCSGFVQSIYAYFSYSLPRVAEAQAGYGMQIPISSAQPGDLIFYARNGYVYHVSMYIGEGQVVQAANKNAGIITSGIAGDAVWATRVITG